MSVPHPPAQETGVGKRSRDQYTTTLLVWADFARAPRVRGTSLSVLTLVIALDRPVTFKDVTEHPGLADLAALLDHQGVGVGVPISRGSSHDHCRT